MFYYKKALDISTYWADNFVELLENWSRLAFVGEEDDQWLPFTKDSVSGLIPDGEPANRFRAWLKVSI